MIAAHHHDVLLLTVGVGALRPIPTALLIASLPPQRPNEKAASCAPRASSVAGDARSDRRAHEPLALRGQLQGRERPNLRPPARRTPSPLLATPGKRG